MLNFQLADQHIAVNSPLVTEMNRFVNLVINEKRFIFDVNNIDFEIKLLVNNNAVKITSGRVEIQDNYLLYYIYYLEFSKKFSFSLSESLEELFTFLKKVEIDSLSSNFQGRSNFLKGVNAVALYHQHLQFKPDMLAYLNTLSKEVDSSLYAFSGAFTRMMPYHKLTLNVLLDILRLLYTFHEFDKPDVFNYNVVELNTAIKKLVTTDINEANKLLDLLFASFDNLNENIAIYVIAGLRKLDVSIVQKLRELAKNKLYQPLVVVSLSQTDRSVEDVGVNLQIVDSIENTSKRYLLQLPSFYSRIINNESITDYEVIIKCFKALKQLIIKEDLDFPRLVLQSLGSGKNHEKEKLDILLVLLNEEHFEIQLTPFINRVFFEFIDYKYYLEFLEAFALKTGFNLDDRIFEHCAFSLRHKYPAGFDEELIKFLNHDLGEIRWMGQRLFKTLIDHHAQLFAFDILKLSPKSQFKLFTSVLSMINAPEDLLPPLLPLAQSSNEFVIESFISRIEIIGEDYGSKVIKVLESQWPEKTSGYEEILARVHRYINEFSAEMDKRDKIKELNPAYTQSTYLNSYLVGYKKELQRSMDESVEKNSIIKQLASTIILARGGGWKHEETGEITQLATFVNSYTLPPSYYLSPDNFQWDMRKEQNENWSKFLEEWEAIL